MSQISEKLPSDALLDSCCQHWNLNSPVFVRKMENIVFSCKKKDHTVYLRLTSPLRRNRAQIQAELQWIEILAKHGLSVPNTLLNIENKKIASFQEEDQYFEAVVFSQITGKHPSLEDMQSPSFLYEMGKLIAKMHLSNQSFSQLHREPWHDERGIRHAKQALLSSSHPALINRFDKVYSRMHKLEKHSKNYGLIHADLGSSNLFLQKDNSIAIIDFDDSCYHWFAFDLAIVIYSMAISAEHPAPCLKETLWLDSLVAGYRSHCNIEDKELENIPLFIEFAYLRLFFWIEHHESLGTFHETALERVSLLKKQAHRRILASPG